MPTITRIIPPKRVAFPAMQVPNLRPIITPIKQITKVTSAIIAAAISAATRS